MGCVNKSSREFTQLAKQHNLDSNTLELITHKYWMETGREDLFPTGIYIQAQLGKTQYQEPSKTVRDLWEASYNTPQTYDSMQEYQKAYEEAQKYFPKDALVHYKNTKGKDVLSVRKPVKELNISINDYLNSDLHTKQEWNDYDFITRQIASDLEKSDNFANAIKIREQYGIDRRAEEDKYLPEILGESGREKETNRTLATATSLTRGLRPNDGKQRGFQKEEFLAHLEVTAREQGTWIDNIKDLAVDKVKRGGAESQIYMSKDGKNFIKLNRFTLLDEEHGIEEFIDRINSHNEFEKYARYSVLGFTEDTEGNVCIVLKQPIIKGSEAQQREIDDYLKESGYKKKELSNGAIGWSNGIYEIWDAEPSNVLKDNAGNLYFIDAVINNTERVSRYNQIAEEDNVAFSHFNLEKPIKLKEKGIAADLASIQANEWHLPEDIQKTVAKKLQKYMDDKSGEIQEVNTTPYFGKEGKTTAKDILTYISKNSTDKDIRTLASYVLKNIGKNGNVSVSFSNNTRGSRGMYYTDSHSVKISKASMTGTDIASAANNMEQTIVHEIAHAITVKALVNSPEVRKELLQIFKDYKQLEKQYGINTGYAAKNPKEFLAEFLGRKAFREALMALPSIGQEKKKSKQTLGQRILNFIKKVLHIGNKSSFFTKADEVIQRVLDQANTQEFFYTDEMERAAEDRNLQPFTFNDGTVIEAPFKPNRQQADALNIMSDFLNSDETTMTLAGYAGTGKTSLMEIIAQKARRQYKSIMFSATTNKAAAVLKSRVGKAGFDAQTLNKVFGINVEVDSSKAYNARNLVTALKEADVFPGTTVVIDEASMINEENYNILNRIARENGLKIIYVGDKAQLAPVNETQISKVFRNSEGKVVELTQVERTDDNAILKEATNIRNGLPLSGESSFNEKGEGVGYLTPNSRDEIGKVIRHYIQGLKDNPNFFRILAYTNKKVTEYNDFVRTLLGYTDPIPHVGEPLTGYNNWGYDWRTKSYRFINSESYKVTRVGKPAQSKISVNGQEFTMTYVPVTMENSLGESDTFNYMDIKGNQENRQAALQLANQKKTLWEQYRKAVGREAKSNILAQINSIDQFLFVNDNIEDSTTHNLLQPKTVDFGYALTIHKSQGSTFTHVLIDDIDVAKASNTQNNAANAMAMVDLGDVGQIADATMEVRSSEDVDLGDLSSVPVESTYSPSPDVANVRQQLEYVGVSRATNTVTVISNNVKKEGSPLNPSTNEVSNSYEVKGSNLNEERAVNEGENKTIETVWDSANKIAEPTGRRQISYTPQGKERQTYTVEDGHIYNKEGKEVFADDSVYRNKILANLAIQEKRAVVIEHKGKKYVVDNHKNITSVTSGKVMQWGEENGDRKTILNEARGKFYNVLKTLESQNTRTATEEEQVKWVTENKEKIVKDYIEINGNVYDPDRVRNILEPLGYNKENLSDFYKAGNMLNDIILDALFNNLSKSDNKTISILTGTPGSGKGFITKGRQEALSKKGLVLDAPFHTIESLQKVVDRAREAGVKNSDIEVIAVYNDILTTYKNSIKRGKNEKRWLPLQYFISSFIKNQGKIKALSDNNSGINIVTIDNSNNQNKEVSIEDAFNWDYTVSKEQFEELKNSIKDDTEITEERKEDLLKGINLGSLAEIFGRGQVSDGRATSGEVSGPESNNGLGEGLSFIDEEAPIGQPQKVSLPSYEYFMDRYEDTEVNAAWKIPLLKDLDKQLSAEATLEENNEILDKMTRILEAKNQEDLLSLNIEEPKTNKTVEQNLTEFEKMTQQINNLLDSNIVSASEIRHVAELIVNSISDTITILQKEEGAAKEFFPNIQTDLDFQNASRKEIVETIGINNLIHRAKQQFDPEQNDYEDFDTIDQADLIIDNWDAIMTLAADTFAMTEGFGIMRNYDKGGFATTQAPNIDIDNFNNYNNDPDAMAESEKDEQEHWQIEQRTIDVLNSMSQLVRLALHDCYQIDKEGNKVMSKWGIAERINPRQAVNSILRWTQGALTLEDMINRMTNKAIQNPWLNQLIERLSDKSGKEADFQSQFFGVFSKHFQPYSVVLLEDGKYHSIPVNNHPALTEAMQTITTQFKIGEHPLFTDRGINRRLLGSEDTTDAQSEFNLHKALTSLKTIQDRLSHNESFDNSMVKEATANIVGVSKILGYPVTEEMLSDVINEENLKKMTISLGFIVKSLDSAKEEQIRTAGTSEAKAYNPFAFNSENGIAGTLRNFLTPITDTLEDTAVSAFYDSGKMYQSYVTPSFMTKLMNKFRLEGKEFEDFIMQEYGNTEWFKSAKNQWDVNKGWRNEWLRLLATDENARKVFDHKVELNFNKHNYMRNMSDAEYTLSLITEYFAETGQKKEAMVPAWFRVPIMSNKPSSEFIKFYSYRGANYKDEIIYGMHQIFNQELSRIQTVNMRNHSKGDAEFIANFDSNGKKFNFLPFLNKYLDASDTSHYGILLKKKLNGEEFNATDEAQLATMTDNIIRKHMEDRVATILDSWEKSGILEAVKNIEGIGTEDAQVKANVENFLWNDNFASKNILQLTITDIAFYKDAEDLQKRLAQIHAPGIRGNIAATDYEGNPVTDGKYRTILIQGLQRFKTNLIANIAEVFDRKIAAAPESQKAQLKALKENLVGENGRYTKIDVTDGQAYSSPSSYRKKAFIFGKWSKHAEEIYQKLLKGEYNYTDLETAFQPLKPFVYSHLQKDMGVANAPIKQMPVPFQAKNSEYLLIMADALLQGEKTSKPNLLRAIYRVMEDSERLNPTKGIDTIQFDSAIKSGLQAPIDLNPFVEMKEGEEAAFEYMKSMIYKIDDQGNPSNEYNTNTYVHEGLYEDYCLQQEVPEHFKNHSQAHGSQIRMITPSDLDYYKNPNADHNDPDNQVFYEFRDYDSNANKWVTKKVRADEYRREYEQTIADNIRESIDNLSEELHIYSTDKKERNIALSKILQREILSSPRYGIDLIQACSIDKETGEFRIPKGDPIQAKRIEQLINSIIKNRVNKQKIAGGPIVQVTNFGASRQLNIRFNDKNGGLLMTREEYEQNPQKKEMSQTDKFNARYGKKNTTGNMTYEEYVKENQAGIAYFEVFIPMWANEIFEKFSNEDGSINIEAMEATDPELLKMISYRIPTEDKYSCAPMKAVGFMPREAGDAIMFPYELTEIDDSDFDVDKRYVMRKDIPIIKKKSHIIRKELFDIVAESYKKQFNKELPNNIASEIEVFLDSPETMRNKSTFTKWLYSQYQRIAYTTNAPKSGKVYRDNKIVDMTWAVLTNEMTADKILNPGGFDVFKRAGYMVAAYKNPANNYTWEQLQKMSIDELNQLSYTEKDLTWLDTQIQFYKQNAAAASLIGVFAVNKVAHATLESNNYFIAVDEICGPQSFTIADTEFGGRMKVDPSHDQEGNLIGKTIGAGVSASADAAKTPVLNLMNINLTTAGIFNTLLRLGMAPNDASLFMSQEIIERILNEFNRENLTNYKPLSTIIDEHLSELREKHDISDDSNINFEPLSRDELVLGLKSEESFATNKLDRSEVIDYKVLLAFQKIRTLVDYMRKPTFATRFNSVSSAVGPLIIDNLIMEHKMEQFMDAGTEDGTHFYDAEGNIIDIDDIFYDHPVLKEFSRTVAIAKDMFKDMPAGSTGFRNLLATLPEGLIDKVYNDKKLLDNLSNFYQSYLLIASRMENPANLKNYIEGFPKYFNEQKFKEKYPDNTLIQAIKMNVAKRTGRPFLSINITGIDEAQKEIYRSAWIDLHKNDPELSKRLFEYCFFRAGIGFSPKTFMSLVPTYVKERLSTDLGNGTKATYVDTYRVFPNINPNVVIDQWIRNNWDNNKLVPKKGGEGTHYIVDLKTGSLIARDPKDMNDLKDNKYIKTRHNGQTYLWKQIIADKTSVHYVMIKPLGNNGEYMEMSLSDIYSPLSDTKETIEDMQESELQATSPSEAEAAETSNSDNITDNEKASQTAELANLLMKQNPKFNKTQALNQIEKMKQKPDIYAGFLVNVFKQKGLDLTKEEAINEFKKMC